MKYKVWFGKKGAKFHTLDEAKRYAEFVFRRTRLVVAITNI